MTWRRKEPRHQQPWQWPSYHGIYRFQRQKLMLTNLLNKVGQYQACWCSNSLRHQGNFFIYDWARSQPMTEDVISVKPSLIGWQLAQPYYSETPRGSGFRSVNPTERWRNRALVRAGFLQHLECRIHRSESSPEGSFALIPHPVARWAKTTS